MIERQEYNRKIISRLGELVEKYPNLRFHQLLFCCDLLHTTPDSEGIARMDDPFYVESETAWKQLKNSKLLK